MPGLDLALSAVLAVSCPAFHGEPPAIGFDREQSQPVVHIPIEPRASDARLMRDTPGADWPDLSIAHIGSIGVRPDDQALRGLLSGNLSLRGPHAANDTIVLLVGPMLNMGESFGPHSLTRRDNSFTLIVESWTDNLPRFKNIPARQASLHSLGRLGPGEYSFAIEWRTLLLDPQIDAARYAYESVKAAERRFVVAADGADVDAVHILEADFASTPLPAELAGAMRLRDLGSTIQVRPDAAQDDDIGLQVGVLAGTASEQSSGNRAKLPLLDEPQAGRALHARIVSPTLFTGHWMRIREASKRGDTIHLIAEIWIDYGPRDKNIPMRHVALVPIGTFEPGEMTVQVQWDLFTARDWNQPYHAATPEQRELHLREVKSHSNVEFMLKSDEQ